MRLRGAISGFGEVAVAAHLAGWRTRPDIQIVAVHDPLAPRRHLAINLVPNVRVYDDMELMLDGEALDFVDIASPPAFHVTAAQSALEAGVHVLVEKPLCLDPREFKELTSLAQRNSRILMCVHNWKYSPVYRRAREIAASGRLGEVRYAALVRLRAQPAGRREQSPAASMGWRTDHKFGGGILIDHGWHVFYLLQWLMGGTMPLSIAAHLGFGDDLKTEDVADLQIEYPCDRLGYAHLSWRSPIRRTSAMIYGSEAALEIQNNHLTLTDRSGRPEDYCIDDSLDDSYHPGWFAGVAEDFERAIHAGAGNAVTRENLLEAKTAVALVSGARKSALVSGARIHLA